MTSIYYYSIIFRTHFPFTIFFILNVYLSLTASLSSISLFLVETNKNLTHFSSYCFYCLRKAKSDLIMHDVYFVNQQKFLILLWWLALWKVQLLSDWKSALYDHPRSPESFLCSPATFRWPRHTYIYRSNFRQPPSKILNLQLTPAEQWCMTFVDVCSHLVLAVVLTFTCQLWAVTISPSL